MIYIAGDHYAVELAAKVKAHLHKRGIAYKDLGAQNAAKKVTLQQIIPAVTEKVLADAGSSGILICGTGVGVEVGANKFTGIRASLCRDGKQAEFARVYDNANVLALGSWLTDEPGEILDAWLAHHFDGDAGRTQMLKDFDSWR